MQCRRGRTTGAGHRRESGYDRWTQHDGRRAGLLGSRYAEQVVLEISQRALQALQVRPDVAGEPLIRVARTSRVLIGSRHTSPDQTVERRSVARIALGLLVCHPFRSSFPRHLDGRARYAVSHTTADGQRPSEKPNNDLTVPNTGEAMQLSTIACLVRE